MPAWVLFTITLIGRLNVRAIDFRLAAMLAETPVTLTPTANPSSTPTRVPTPSLVLQPQYTSEEIQGFIERFAGQYAVDPNALRHIADCESDFNPRAKNGDYLGLYQFSTNTWKNNRLLIGEDADPTLRLNAEEAVQTASFLLSIGKG